MRAREMMTRPVITVAPDTNVRDIARLLVRHHINGVPVVDARGRIVGIVTAADLIVRDANVHLPRFIQILDSFLYLENPRRSEEEIRKALGIVARDLMSSPVVSVDADATIEEVATLMVDKRVNPLPVVERGALVGIVSRADLVRLIARDVDDD